jgi:hypothetical protein
MPNARRAKGESKQSAGFKDTAMENCSTCLVSDPARVRIKRGCVVPRAIKIEHRHQAYSGGRNIENILQDDFVAAGDTQLNGAHTSGVHMRPTNAGDRVWCYQAEKLKV